MNNITLLKFNYNFIAKNNLVLSENIFVRKFRITDEANSILKEQNYE